MEMYLYKWKYTLFTLLHAHNTFWCFHFMMKSKSTHVGKVFINYSFSSTLLLTIIKSCHKTLLPYTKTNDLMLIHNTQSIITVFAYPSNFASFSTVKRWYIQTKSTHCLSIKTAHLLSYSSVVMQHKWNFSIIP